MANAAVQERNIVENFNIEKEELAALIGDVKALPKIEQATVKGFILGLKSQEGKKENV
ncbi:hypothetical protein [Eubacterium ventriosum]|uniref:hypothetical protein n=1 Tax=Eubacterium ventriosum TaxID=39496 RepID=UPI00265D6841|nr:hypothetical protein [Eubacterium ventriosum]